MRRLASHLVAPAAAMFCLFQSAAYADPIVITAGDAGFYDTDRAGILLIGAGTRLVGDGFGGWGASVNPVTGVGTVGAVFSIQDIVPLGRQQTVNGTTYNNVFLHGSVGFTGAPFAVPPPVPGDDRRFSTRFVATGQLSGFPTPFGGTPFFTVDIVGGGVLGFSGRVAPGNDPPVWNFAARPAGAQFDTLDNPAATPEPGTMLLLGSAVTGLALTRWRKRRTSAAAPAAR